MKFEQLYKRGKCVVSLEHCVITYSLVLEVTEDCVKTLSIVEVPFTSEPQQEVTLCTRHYPKAYLQAKIEKYPHRYKRCDIHKNPEIYKVIKNALSEFESARLDVMQTFFPETSRVGVQL